MRGITFWTVLPAILAICAACIALQCATASAQQPQTSGSWVESIKRQFSKLGGSKPKSTAVTMSEDDPVSLTNKNKPGPRTYVAVARLYAEMNKPADAEQQYQLALREQPDYLPALLGYAQLKEQMGQAGEALQIYQRAAKAHPRQPSVYNNMGLCYARQKRHDAAAGALGHAVELAPKNPLYRNNLAMVLVDQNRLPEAFEQLQGVHGEAAAYYNIGFLLNRKGQTQAAMRHFELALKADPSLTRAQLWLGYLQKTAEQPSVAQAAPRQEAAQPPAAPQSASPRAENALQAESLTIPPEPPVVRRLPPVAPRESAPLPPQELATMPQESAPLPPLPPQGGPNLPGISYERYQQPPSPSAPGMNTAVRPLPRVN